MTKAIIITLCNYFILIGLAFPVQAAPRGTPTIVTNDASSPVVVTGTIAATNGAMYKPVGVTTQKVSEGKTNFAKSLACAREFSNSRICTSEEMINYPAKIQLVDTYCAHIMPTYVSSANFNSSAPTDISGALPRTIGAETTVLYIVNEDIARYPDAPCNAKYPNSIYPVVCCAP